MSPGVFGRYTMGVNSIILLGGNMNRLVISHEISLEHELQRLALEANFIHNLAEQFNTLLPTIATKLSDHTQLFRARLFEKPRVRELYIAFDQTKAVTKQLPFANHQDTLVSIPEGFKGDFMDYLNLLIKLHEPVYKEANNLLSEYNGMLASFITNKDAKTSNSEHKGLYQKATQHREAIIKQIGVYFTRGDQSKAPLKTMVQRFSDVKVLTDIAVDLERRQDPQLLTQIADATEKAIQLLGIIRDQLEQDKLTEVSGVSASSIATGAYELGQFIEFVAMYHYKCNQAVTAVKNTLERIAAFN